jgi:hypothetical protein
MNNQIVNSDLPNGVAFTAKIILHAKIGTSLPFLNQSGVEPSYLRAELHVLNKGFTRTSQGTYDLFVSDFRYQMNVWTA